MKHILRIPTTEQYAYVEAEFEGTSEDAVEAYRRLTDLVRGGAGITDKEFNDFLDVYLETGSIPNGADIYARMDLSQQATVQCIKRSINRRKRN